MQYKIGVITNSTTGQSFRDLAKSAERFNVAFEAVSTNLITLSDFNASTLIQQLATYDAVYYRTGLRDTILEQLAEHYQKVDKPFINGGKHHNAHRKIQQALIANKHNIQQPKSCTMRRPNFDALKNYLGTPFVMKPDSASHGNDVALITNETDLLNILEHTKRDRFIFQEFIQDAIEYRVYTLGNRYIASYKKIASDTDFRANLHAGGSMTPTEPERVPLLKNFSEHVASAFHADIAGIDVFVKDNQCIFIELNWQPGWENLDALTGTYFADETIKYIVSAIQHSTNKTEIS